MNLCCSDNRYTTAPKSATYALNTTSKRVIQKTVEATVDFTGNKEMLKGMNNKKS